MADISTLQKEYFRRKYPMKYPDLRTRPAPLFLTEKYKDVAGLLAEVQRRTSDAGDVDVGHFTKALPDFNSAFKATAEELEAAFTGSSQEITIRRKVIWRLMLWENLDEVSVVLNGLYDRVIRDMPRKLLDIEEAGGGRDILDPFIVAFTSRLLHSGNVSDLLRTLVSHKCLMKLEDLIGHLHGEVLGRAAGGECIPEPQGIKDANGKRNKENWHEELNPYPGADARRDKTEFYQIKNKTGSAKGSDGEKLGRQFLTLKEKYPTAQRFYVSMIGRTLKGHRSMGAFLRTDPDAEVLVGLTAFQQLGRHRDTAEIVMDFCLDEFDNALDRNHFDFDEVVASMAHEWTEKHGDTDPILDLLRDSISPSDPADQSSNTYRTRGKR